jgi:hypothetical protein
MAGVDWIHLAQDRDHGGALMVTIMKHPMLGSP